MLKQTKLHDPSNGIIGNCMQTAIANMLGKSIDDVPAFAELYTDNHNFDKALTDYLDSQNIYRCAIYIDGNNSLECVLDLIGGANTDFYWLLSGKSSRNINHVVICKDNKFYFDPHPSDAFIEKPLNNNTWLVEILAIKINIE